MSWHTGRLAGLDFETTGIDVESDRIVTACVVQVGGDHPTVSADWLADPGVPIPDEAAAIHGVTTDRARSEGRSAVEVVEEVTAALAQVQLHGIPIVAMNAAYDLTLLDRECRRHGVTPLVDLIGPEELRVIDPMVLDRKIDRYRKGSRNLSALCQHYQVPLDSAHTADADAIAACRVAWRIGQREPVLSAAGIDFLHEKQIEWAAEQAEDRRAYFARTPGKEHLADRVRGDWPLVPSKAVTG